MFRCGFVLLLVVNFCSGFPTEDEIPRHKRIIGGKPYASTEHPYHVSLEFNGDHKCGGTLITNKWVLTAAHCFDNKQELGTEDVSKWQVNVRSLKRKIGILAVKKSPKYELVASEVAMKAYLYVMDRKEAGKKKFEYCGPSHVNYNYDKSVTCVRSQNWAIGPGSGDSGSPLLAESQGVTSVVGVYSYSITPCEMPGYPAVYTSVSSCRDWIKTTIRK